MEGFCEHGNEPSIKAGNVYELFQERP